MKQKRSANRSPGEFEDLMSFRDICETGRLPGYQPSDWQKFQAFVDINYPQCNDLYVKKGGYRYYYDNTSVDLVIKEFLRKFPKQSHTLDSVVTQIDKMKKEIDKIKKNIEGYICDSNVDGPSLFEENKRLKEEILRLKNRVETQQLRLDILKSNQN